MRHLWLADVLDDAGLKVVELAGWRGRGAETGDVEGVMLHHTATGPGVADKTVDKLLCIGRPDLSGPLANLGLRRDGTWVVVASGRANHAGSGELPWGGSFGNGRTLGVEAYNDGTGEPWPEVQADALIVGVAALVAHVGLDAARVTTHHEYAPARKIGPAGPVRWQPNGGTWAATTVRAEVARTLNRLPEDDDMPAPLLIPCPQLGGTPDAYAVAEVGRPLRLVRWAQPPAWLPSSQTVTAIGADNRTVELSAASGVPHGKYTLL